MAGTEHCLCADLYNAHDTKSHHWPIIYSDSYNITFFGMEKLHPFDATKWRNVFNFLCEANMVTSDSVVVPVEITREQLEEFHTKKYLDSLSYSPTVARITEVPPVGCLPNKVVQWRLLSKLRLQTAGTIMAAKLALDRGWSINLGGGFHHCSHDEGGGFCVYADISGALLTLHKTGLIKSALIIDLDAHQGNGHQRDFMSTEWVRTLDVYNGRIYPHDSYAKRMKNLMAVEIEPYTADKEYLKIISRKIESMLSLYGGDSRPDIIAYNAGTDCMVNDPLGLLRITDKGIIKRDEIVFRKAQELSIPIFMVLSGGYQRVTARVIADSILNLRSKGLISCADADNHIQLENI